MLNTDGLWFRLVQTLGRRGPFLLRRYRSWPHVLCRCRSRLSPASVPILRGSPLFERLARDQQLDLGRIQRLAFEQRFRDPNQRFAIFRTESSSRVRSR